MPHSFDNMMCSRLNAEDDSITHKSTSSTIVMTSVRCKTKHWKALKTSISPSALMIIFNVLILKQFENLKGENSPRNFSF